MSLATETNLVEENSPHFYSGLRVLPLKPKAEVQTKIYLIEDDLVLREDGRNLFESAGWAVEAFSSAEAFLASPRPIGNACLVIDVMLPGIDGVKLLEILRAEGSTVPAIMLTGLGDAATAVAAMKTGAADFVEKPATKAILIASIIDAIRRNRDVQNKTQLRERAKSRFKSFSPRETEVLTMILQGAPNKNIAVDLGISQRTVEAHRANLMRKCGVKSLPALMELYLLAYQIN